MPAKSGLEKEAEVSFSEMNPEELALYYDKKAHESEREKIQKYVEGKSFQHEFYYHLNIIQLG